MEKFHNLPSKDFWLGKKVLITGHTGFKGSWLTIFLKHLGAKIYGVSLNDEKFRFSNKLDLSHILESSSNIDIFNQSSKLDSFINEIQPDIVFHLAAMSILKECNDFPKIAFQTNSIGTFNVFNSTLNNSNCRLIVSSTTDKVYKYPNQINDENSELGAFEFYGASKVAAEGVIEVFKEKYKDSKERNFLTIRSGNVLGGGDYGLYRLIPDVIRSLNNNERINLRYPSSTRPWQYVLDSINGYLLASEFCFNNNKSEIFNLNEPALNDVSVIELTKKLRSIWNSQVEIEIEPNVEFREAKELNITSKKASKILGWKAFADIDYIFNQIKIWETADNSELFDISFSQIKDFEKMAKKNGF